jgi:hypothetical protein
MQRIPDFDIIPHDDEDVVCDECGEFVAFLIEGPPNRCKDCFSDERPEFSGAVADFADLLDILVDIRDRLMTQEEMHDLYGKEETDTEK